MRHSLHFLIKPPYGLADMVAGGTAAAPVPFADFLLRKTTVKRQVKHFLFFYRQTGEGLYQQAVVQDNHISAKAQD